MSRTEAKAFFDAYAACFSRDDVEGVLAHWTLPAFISGSAGKSGVFHDGESFRRNTRALCDFYARLGASRAEKHILDVQLLYDNVTMVRTGDRLSGADGKAVAEWEHVYLLRRRPDGWKVFMAVADGELEAWQTRGTPLGATS